MKTGRAAKDGQDRYPSGGSHAQILRWPRCDSVWVGVGESGPKTNETVC